MKAILRGYGVGMTTLEKQNARARADDMTKVRGTARIPGQPRDVFAQSGPRGVLLNWRLPAGLNSDVTGFRIYKDDETKLFAEIKDPTTTQHFVEVTAGSSPPVTNFFVSSINGLGIESKTVMIQSSATVEAGAPSMPVTPPTYTKPDVSSNPRVRTEQP